MNIGRSEQFTPEFLAISPDNRMPAIVDHAPAFGDATHSVNSSREPERCTGHGTH